MAAAEGFAAASSSDDECESYVDSGIHMTDSGGLILVESSSTEMVSSDKINDPAHLRRKLAELASELLRLQDGGAEPRVTGAFSPEVLRRWAGLAHDAGYEAPSTPGGCPGAPISSPATPSRSTQTTPLDSLPTPTSASDGRSEAASLLRSKIKNMQSNDKSEDPSVESNIADFTSDHEELRVKKGEAEAEAALLSAELVALRGRHEEEKIQWMKTAKDLRRRNEELENRIATQRVGGSKTNSSRAGPKGRSISCPRIVEGEDQQEESKFGFGMRALAQRWRSPHPTRRNSQGSSLSVEEREETQFAPGSSFLSNASTIDTNALEYDGKDATITITSNNEESMKLIAALEASLQESEHRATVLEQRLNIVKESGDAVIQSLNEELADVAEDRARSEAAMVKELSILDTQRRAERSEYEKRIQEWIAHDANRKQEVEEYEKRIESLIGTVRMMGVDMAECNDASTSSSWDREAEEDMKKDLIEYIGSISSGSRSLVNAINDEFDLQFNANPNVADDMIEYYRSRPDLKEFTLQTDLPRMDYEVLAVDTETGKDIKLHSTDEIRSYFASIEESTKDDEEIDIILRAANQSLLADPLAMLTGEGDGKLVHLGSFHSTVIATVCAFKLDLRSKGQRRIKVQCELAISVPSGNDGTKTVSVQSENESEKSGTESSDIEDKEESSATLELARANLIIQFSPSPTSTPSGPLVKYGLMDIKPTISDYEEGSDEARAIQSAAAALARDRFTHIQGGGNKKDVRSNVKSRFLSKVKQLSRSD